VVTLLDLQDLRLLLLDNVIELEMNWS